jgi:outer membrane protein TolC
MLSRSLPILIACALATPARADRALSLADALGLARAHRSEVTQADIELRRAHLGVLRAWLQRAHLTVQASVSEQVQQLNLNGPSQACSATPGLCSIEAHPFSGQATLNVPIWSGLTVEAELAKARALERAATADVRTALNSVALEAATAYWEVRRFELAIDVARRSLDRTRDIERAARARVDAGIAPQVDVERARVQTLRQMEQVTAIEAQLAVARAELGAALQLDERFHLVEDPAAHVPSLPSLDRALAEAARSRPELTSASAQVEAQTEAVRSAKGGYSPQLSLFGQATAGNQLFQLTPPQTQELLVFTAIAGVQLNWVLFDSLSTWTAVRDAGLTRDRVTESAVRLRYQVRADVEGAHGRLAAALQRKAIATDAVTAARRALDLLQRRYQVGSSLLLELILAQADLTNLEGDLLDAQVTTAEAAVALQAALGRL